MAENLHLFVAFLFGWLVSMSVRSIGTSISMRLLASAAGKRAVLSALARGIEKLDQEGHHG